MGSPCSQQPDHTLHESQVQTWDHLPHLPKAAPYPPSDPSPPPTCHLEAQHVLTIVHLRPFFLSFLLLKLGWDTAEWRASVLWSSGPPVGGTMAHLPVYGTIVCTGVSTLEKPLAPPNLGQPQYAHATESRYASPSGLCLPKVSCYGRVHLSPGKMLEKRGEYYPAVSHQEQEMVAQAEERMKTDRRTDVRSSFGKPKVAIQDSGTQGP